MGKILARLQAAGLITRVRDPANRRRIEAALTPSGRTALENAHQTEQAHVPQESSLIGTLRHELLKVIATFNTPASGAAPAATATPTRPGRARHASNHTAAMGPSEPDHDGAYYPEQPRARGSW